MKVVLGRSEKELFWEKMKCIFTTNPQLPELDAMLLLLLNLNSLYIQAHMPLTEVIFVDF